MYALAKSRIFWNVWQETLKSLDRPSLLLPFLIYATLQFFILIGLVYFVYPPFSHLFLPLQQWLFGETALHYPNNFVVLPNAFDLLNFALNGVVGVLVIAISTLMFYQLGDAKAPRLQVGRAGRRYLHLFFVWIIEAGLAYGILMLFANVSARLAGLATLLHIARYVAVITVSSLFVYTTILIVIENRPAWLALAGSIKYFKRYTFVTLLFVGLPSLWQVPIQYLNGHTAAIIRRLNPEIIAVIIGGGIIFSLAASYLIVGSVTLFYRHIRHTNSL